MINQRFELFWRAYPRRVGKLAAKKAFEKLSATEQAEVIEHLKDRVRDVQWTKAGGQFIPHPTTFLNQGRWMDEYETTETVQAAPVNFRAMSDDDLIKICNERGVRTHGRTRFELIMKLEGKQ